VKTNRITKGQRRLAIRQLRSNLDAYVWALTSNGEDSLSEAGLPAGIARRNALKEAHQALSDLIALEDKIQCATVSYYHDQRCALDGNHDGDHRMRPAVHLAR